MVFVCTEATVDGTAWYWDGDQTVEFRPRSYWRPHTVVHFTGHLDGVEGAPGAQLRVVTDGGVQAFDPVPVTSADFEYRFRLPRAASWASAQVYGDDAQEGREELCNSVVGADGTEPSTYCENRIAMLALTSAIYLRPSH